MHYPSQDLAHTLKDQGLINAYAVHGRLFNIGTEQTWVTFHPVLGHMEDVRAALRQAEVPFLECCYFTDDRRPHTCLFSPLE